MRRRFFFSLGLVFLATVAGWTSARADIKDNPQINPIEPEVTSVDGKPVPRGATGWYYGPHGIEFVGPGIGHYPSSGSSSDFSSHGPSEWERKQAEEKAKREAEEAARKRELARQAWIAQKKKEFAVSMEGWARNLIQPVEAWRKVQLENAGNDRAREAIQAEYTRRVTYIQKLKQYYLDNYQPERSNIPALQAQVQKVWNKEKERRREQDRKIEAMTPHTTVRDLED